MDALINKLQNLLSENIEWQIYFYIKIKSRNNQNPYVAFSWNATSNSKLIPNLVTDIVNFSINEFKKHDYTVQNYTPNNNKTTIDKTATDNLLINKNYENLIEALSKAKPYSHEIEKPNGYILVGSSKDDEANRYILIGTGTPVKNYKHAFFNQAIMKELESNLIVIKSFWDIFIHNGSCYMRGTQADTFFDLISYHSHNMAAVNKLLEKSDLVENVPANYPKSGKGIFTDILNFVNLNNDIDFFIKRIIERTTKYPNDKYYEKLIFKNGKIDLSDTECHIALIELLAFRYFVADGEIRAEVRPINISLPQ